MMPKIRIDICICTFQRPHIVTTLKSLSCLDTPPDWDVRVIVADNDDTPSAESLVLSTASTLPFPVHYVHAPARNISIARNACLDASASSDYMAFMDDDELADRNWLTALMSRMTSSQDYAAVLGPVDAIYPAICPAWMRTGNFHATRPVFVRGEIITGYSCNLLLKTSVVNSLHLRFRTELGKTGGEDSVFLSTLYQNGGKITYAPEALLQEPVPENRASLLWLMKRRFRSGQTHAVMCFEKNTAPIMSFRIKLAILASAKALLCAIMAILSAWNPPKMIEWLLRGTLHVGVLARLSGKKELIQYGT